MLSPAVITVLCLLFLLTWCWLAPLSDWMAHWWFVNLTVFGWRVGWWQFVCLDRYLWLSIPEKLMQLTCFFFFISSHSAWSANKVPWFWPCLFFSPPLGTLILGAFFLFSLWYTVVTLSSITAMLPSTSKKQWHKLPSTAWNAVLHAWSTSAAFKPANSSHLWKKVAVDLVLNGCCVSFCLIQLYFLW